MQNGLEIKKLFTVRSKKRKVVEKQQSVCGGGRGDWQIVVCVPHWKKIKFAYAVFVVARVCAGVCMCVCVCAAADNVS